MKQAFSRPLAILAVMGLAACGTEAVTSTTQLTPSTPSFSLGPQQSIPAGSTVQNINSNSSIQYCGFNSTIAPVAATVFSGGCGPAFDLTSAIALYNPGWPAVPAAEAPSAWIGAQANANDYFVLPGTYTFSTTFNMPAGTTSRLLNLLIRGDNVAIVYVNGVEIGRTDAITEDNANNWNNVTSMFDNGTFVDGLNTLRVDLINTRIGLHPPAAGDACALGPQPGSSQTIAGGWSVSDCKNPSAVEFAGTASYIVPAPPPPPPATALFVIGDDEAHAITDNVNFWGAQWWKNNSMSGVVSNGVASFKGYADLSDNVCGGTWSSRPGNSSNPPDVIPADVAIIVTSKVIKNGPNISGDIKQIVIVHQDGGYGPNPGHAGNGPVKSIVCTAP